MTINQKQHWEKVYETKTPAEVSWTQEIPKTSLEFISSLKVSKDAKIIDIGGGDSKLVDYLLAAGYINISILDISKEALERAKRRLGENAVKVEWIVSDINDFTPTETYDIWHDRAAFHFLTSPEQIERYIGLANKYISRNLIIGTFSKKGPLKCSGLNITQYNEEGLLSKFNTFEKIKCIAEDHTTPFNTKQNFTFCSFKKKS